MVNTELLQYRLEDLPPEEASSESVLTPKCAKRSQTELQTPISNVIVRLIKVLVRVQESMWHIQFEVLKG